MTTLLSMNRVGFGFGEREVLRDVSFFIDEGSCTALIGPNGIGKTTLLRLAAGGLTPSMGEVSLGGLPHASLDRKERARRLALVPQRLEVPFRFTVREIVEQGRTPYSRMLRGLGREDRVAVDRAMDLAHVSGLQHRVFNELSGGERQRVKIALGLAQEPRLLLLDEPTQNLDIGRQVELLDLLHLLLSEGITIFASIHDLHLVHGNFTSVILLGPDHRLISGPAEEVMTSENLEWAFNCPPERQIGLQRDELMGETL